jgi:uncharacterized membrane protein YgaE (UPF0421/DUF939 family)
MADEAINEAEADEEVEVADIEEESDDEGNDKTDWKAEAQKQAGIAKRLKTKLDRQKLDDKVEKKVEERVGSELDRIDRAVLRAEKITDPDEVELVQDIMKETGKPLEKVLESKYFQSELKEMRETKATKEATPSGTKRPGANNPQSVEYWLAKGELPKDAALKGKVIDAKIARARADREGFSDTPVIG